MREYYYLMDQDPFEVLPLTFLIKRGKGQAESDFHRFQLYFNNLAQEIKCNARNRVLEIEKRTHEIKYQLKKRRREVKRKLRIRAMKCSEKKLEKGKLSVLKNHGGRMTRNSQNKSKTEQYESTGDDSESD